MKTLPQGIFRKAASCSFMTYFSFSPLFLPPSTFAPQHCEENQLKRTRGSANTKRFRWRQGQPNTCRIHWQQFQRQKKWQVTWMWWWMCFPHLLFSLWSTFKSTTCSSYSMLCPERHRMTDVCLLIYFAANRGIQCSTQVRTICSLVALKPHIKDHFTHDTARGEPSPTQVLSGSLCQS